MNIITRARCFTKTVKHNIKNSSMHQMISVLKIIWLSKLNKTKFLSKSRRQLCVVVFFHKKNTNCFENKTKACGRVNNWNLSFRLRKTLLKQGKQEPRLTTKRRDKYQLWKQRVSQTKSTSGRVGYRKHYFNYCPGLSVYFKRAQTKIMYIFSSHRSVSVQ